jgi:hypothetical protein
VLYLLFVVTYSRSSLVFCRSNDEDKLTYCTPGFYLGLNFAIEGFQARSVQAPSKENNYQRYSIPDPCDVETFTADPWRAVNRLVQVADGNSPTEDAREKPELLRVLPCAKSDAGKEVEDDGSSYWHFDSSGKSCFTAFEAKRATERLKSMDFIERIIEDIKTTNFIIPQKDVYEDATYCNEQVYGKFTYLQVTGVVSLE